LAGLGEIGQLGIQAIYFNYSTTKQLKSVGKNDCKPNNLFNFQPFLFRREKWSVFFFNSNRFLLYLQKRLEI